MPDVKQPRPIRKPHLWSRPVLPKTKRRDYTLVGVLIAAGTLIVSILAIGPDGWLKWNKAFTRTPVEAEKVREPDKKPPPAAQPTGPTTAPAKAPELQKVITEIRIKEIPAAIPTKEAVTVKSEPSPTPTFSIGGVVVFDPPPEPYSVIMTQRFIREAKVKFADHSRKSIPYRAICRSAGFAIRNMTGGPIVLSLRRPGGESDGLIAFEEGETLKITPRIGWWFVLNHDDDRVLWAIFGTECKKPGAYEKGMLVKGVPTNQTAIE